jgi:hypothetical protein
MAYNLLYSRQYNTAFSLVTNNKINNIIGYNLFMAYNLLYSRQYNTAFSLVTNNKINNIIGYNLNLLSYNRKIFEVSNTVLSNSVDYSSFKYIIVPVISNTSALPSGKQDVLDITNFIDSSKPLITFFKVSYLLINKYSNPFISICSKRLLNNNQLAEFSKGNIIPIDNNVITFSFSKSANMINKLSFENVYYKNKTDLNKISLNITPKIFTAHINNILMKTNSSSKMYFSMYDSKLKNNIKYNTNAGNKKNISEISIQSLKSYGDIYNSKLSSDISFKKIESNIRFSNILINSVDFKPIYDSFILIRPILIIVGRINSSNRLLIVKQVGRI